MPAGGLVSAGVGALIGGAEYLYGNSQKKKYQQQMDSLSANAPKYQIPQEEMNNQALAESMANQGMGASARAQLQNNTDRNLGTLASSALMGGADANAIGNLADKTQNAYNQNAMYDDQVRLQHLAGVQNAWARTSADRDKEWQINDYQPWKNKMTGLYGQLQGANTMAQSGLNMFGGGLMSGLGKIGATPATPETHTPEFINQTPYIDMPMRQIDVTNPISMPDNGLQPLPDYKF